MLCMKKKFESFFFCLTITTSFILLLLFKAMAIYSSYNPLLQPDEDQDTLVMEQHPYSLVVWNDEVNTFEWVIETLIQVCKHSQEQAEQCALLIHNKGKYAVKNGSYETLKPQCDAITDRAIGATLEVMA